MHPFSPPALEQDTSLKKANASSSCSLTLSPGPTEQDRRGARRASQWTEGKGGEETSPNRRLHKEREERERQPAFEATTLDLSLPFPLCDRDEHALATDWRSSRSAALQGSETERRLRAARRHCFARSTTLALETSNASLTWLRSLLDCALRVVHAGRFVVVFVDRARERHATV